MEAVQPTAPVAQLRGFCYECGAEAVPLELEDGSFECPLCHESCVECPYESFEHWQGVWQVWFTDGYTNQLTIDEHGMATLGRNDGGGSGRAQLAWVPGEQQDFLMRLEGHRRQGVREYLRLEPGGEGLTLRREALGAPAVAGNGRRALPEAPSAPAAAALAAPAAPGAGWPALDGFLGNFMEIMDRLAEEAENAEGDEAMPDATGAGARPGTAGANNLQEALDQSLEQLAATWPGLGGADREQLRRQVHHLAGPLAGILAQGGPFAQGGQYGGLGWHFAQHLGPRPVGLGRLQQEQAASEAAVAAWLDAHGLEGTGELEPDWQCPICFDSATRELVTICHDKQGHAAHVFHRDCVATWLVKRNECPSCRRTPVVGEALTPVVARPAFGIEPQPAAAPSQLQLQGQVPQQPQPPGE